MEIALCERMERTCSESIKTETGIYVCRNDFHLTSNMACDCPDKRIVEIIPQQLDTPDPKTQCTCYQYTVGNAGGLSEKCPVHRSGE